MNIRKKIKLDLKDSRVGSLCKDVFMLHKPNNIIADTYIEWQILSDDETDFSGNKNLSEEYLIQVDIFTKGDFTFIEEAIRLVFKEKGYGNRGCYDGYEKDTFLYTSKMRFGIKI
ncbi:hypothetical protein KPL39_02160 [Clostridium gasigenes]|uniref:hypothetical protein n=1 Tax=Clostridium gasigenes TaxID=94869 RepID=UPI001C0C66CB|nr:hypothetical protein [Clostridium gasigenes]MBU3135065.1 hypothetical protein [Clostridium gasigenes]